MKRIEMSQFYSYILNKYIGYICICNVYTFLRLSTFLMPDNKTCKIVNDNFGAVLFGLS